MARGRRPRKVNQSKRRRSAASARRRREESAGIDRRGSYLATRNRPDIRTGSNNRFVAPKPDAFSGREQGIAAANTGSKEDKLQQSVGSLDRRIATALEKKDTDLAKDLRSRQNKFVKELALERVRKTPGGTIQGNVRMRDGTRPMTTAGFNVFQDTIDRDFLDPTRRLQNIYPEQAREMYPIESRLQMGLPTVQAIKALFDIKDKPIPYTDPRMPGERYALDFTPEGEVFAAPTEDVFMEDLTDDKSVPLSGTLEEELPVVLPNMAPFIDKETRNEVFAQDVDNLPANNYNKLLEEFQKESAEYEKTKAEEPTVADKYPYEVAGPNALPSYFNLFGQNDPITGVQDELTSEALQGPGYNLDPNVINNLYDQGFLESGTNYIDNNSLLNEALASYYDSLK
jgi:hypothetical protein